MALHYIDAVHDGARPDGTRATADLTQAAVVELKNLLGTTCTHNDADGAGFPKYHRRAILAAETHRRELLSEGSEGQLARLLHLDHVELREMLYPTSTAAPTSTAHRVKPMARTVGEDSSDAS